MDVDVRSISKADLPQLVRLCRRHAEYEGAIWLEDDQLERWAEALFSTSPELFGWVAEANGRVCGFMTVTIDYSTWDAARFSHMDCLYIEDEYRGYGVGRRFFSCLDVFCSKRNIGQVQWQTPPDNQLGIGFYQRMGATQKPKLRFFRTVSSRDEA